MSEPLARGEATIALIPQKPPFVLVDRLLSASPTLFRSAFTVPADHLLVSNGALLDAGVMENAAQTAALGMGHQAAQAGAAPPLGFIGAIARLSITGRVRTGETLETTVEVKHEVMNARILEAVSTCDGRPVCTLELKVFIMYTPPLV